MIAVGAMFWSPLAFAAVATAVMGVALAEWLQLIRGARALSISRRRIVGVALLLIAIGARDVVALVVVPLSALASAVWFVIARGRDTAE